jgi:hypothetical protein
MNGFNSAQISRLQQATRPPSAGLYSGAPNPKLDAVIAQLKLESPHLFHTVGSLSKRVFWNQPATSVPYARHHVSIKPR